MQRTTLYLASASPRRHEILKQLLIPHSVLHVPSPEGEDEPQLLEETPEDYVRRTAREKAVRATRWLDNAPTPGSKVVAGTDAYVLSADTTVVLDQEILGKPQDRADAANTLRKLSGKVHYVYTALALHHGQQIFEALSISTVHFKNLSDVEIESYCATDDPMGKAGAYGIQGPAAAFITHLSGSYTGVMGLPAYETSELLAATGWHATAD